MTEKHIKYRLDKLMEGEVLSLDQLIEVRILEQQLKEVTEDYEDDTDMWAELEAQDELDDFQAHFEPSVEDDYLTEY